MDSIPVAISRLRIAIAEFLEDVRLGNRIRITRHGKPVAWIIGKTDYAVLERVYKNRRARLSPKTP